jgi:two-component system, cell cycle response regulator DivK
MPGEEFENGRQNRSVAQSGAQNVGGEAGQGQQALGTRLIGQNPAQRLQRNGLGCPFVGVGSREVSSDLPVSIKRPRCRRFRGNENAVPKRILVVEDNDLNRKLFCDVLKANGFEVVPVADGQNVLPTARKSKPDAVVLDIQLPNVSGLELIEAFGADRALRAIPILAVTAYAGKGDEEKIRAAGAKDYLAKPVSITPFMAAVRGLMAVEDAAHVVS